MYILIDNKNGTPIYDQIYTQIKNQILSGELEPDSALPSIRALAKELLREENLKKIEGHIDEILSLAAACGLSQADILEMVRFAMEGET